MLKFLMHPKLNILKYNTFYLKTYNVQKLALRWVLAKQCGPH